MPVHTLSAHKMKVPVGEGLSSSDLLMLETTSSLRVGMVSLLQKELCKKSRDWSLPAPFNDQELFLGTIPYAMPSAPIQLMEASNLHPARKW